MAESITVSVKIVAETCCTCGVVFGLSEGHKAELRRTTTWFYCPNGHQQYYSGKSEEAKLRDELTRKQAALDQAWATANDQRRQLEAERRSTAAIKGMLTKVKKRIGGGVCPCCNRYFPALHRHMKTQHPTEAKAVAP